MTGTCKVLPAAAPDKSSYVLVTGGESAVWILAVKNGENIMPGMTYQIFSSASREWGPVKRSARLLEQDDMDHVYRCSETKAMVVCRGSSAVYFLGDGVPSWKPTTGGGSGRRVMAFAIDVRTERTWTTELPEKYAELKVERYKKCPSLSLATASNGRLSLVVSMPASRQIEGWVLVEDGRWTLLPDLVPEQCRNPGQVWLRSYCFRRGRLFVDVDDRDLLIDVDEDLPDRRIQRIVRHRVSCYPYELDWSTYILRMKCF